MIQIPGVKDLKDASTLNAEDLAKLRENAELEGKSAAQLQIEMMDIAQNQLSAQDKANISLEQIKNSLIFAKGTAGLDVYPEELEKMSKTGSQMGELMTAAEKTTKSLDTLDNIIKQLNTDLFNYVDDNTRAKEDIATALTNFKNALSAAYPSGGFGTSGTAGGGGARTTPVNTDINVNSAGDLFVGKTGKDKVVSTGVGEFYKLNFNDEILAMPNVTELMNDANTAFGSISKLEGYVGNSMSENLMNFVKNVPTKVPENFQSTNITDLVANSIGRLQEVGETVINQNISSSQRIDGNVGVDGNVNINVNVPNGLLSNALSSDREFQGALKDEIMKVVNYRLSEAYKKGQGNFS
jgi:hypothetical protein